MKTLLNGATVCYGTGSGNVDRSAPTLVFVHGAGFDHSVWVMPARYFARHGYFVVAPDLPAHGRSGGAALSSIDAMADWLAQLIEQECSGAVTMIGHSMGSLVTMAFAHRHSALLERMVLLGTSAPMPVGPPLLNAAADNDHAAIDMANTWSHSARGRLGSAQNPGLSNLNSGERWLERMADGVYHSDLQACHEFTGELDIGDGDVPTLVIAGAEDRMTPAKAGLKLAAALRNAQAVVLPDCGHSMLAEQPNQVLDALAEFILE